MSPTFARLLGACAALACLSLAPVHKAEAHYDDAYYYDGRDLPAQPRWMEALDDDTLLRNISIPGTHGSTARHGGWASENQTLSIRQQLDAGIRFLDLRTRHYYNTLEMHHGIVYQHINFGSVLDEIVGFLQAHPTETVLIRVKEEASAEGNTRPLEVTVDSYFDKYGKHFHTRADWDTRLGDLRGKIVMLKEFEGHTRFGFMNYFHQTIRQDDYNLSSNWDLYGKWEKVKNTINLANQNGPEPDPFVNFLSGSGGAYPYFVASGHQNPDTSAPGLSTGLTTPGWNGWYPDFPRGSCFIGICSIYFEGTNTLTKNYLRNQSIRYAGIIAADFPGAGLIQSVIEVNHTRRMIANPATGRCLDIEGGAYINRNLISWDCHDGWNQRFTVRGEQILVGGLCLDVAGASMNQGARVILWPCHGGANQRWRLDGSGRIRSMMAGVPRCLDMNVGDGHRVGVWTCTDYPGQDFRTRLN